MDEEKKWLLVSPMSGELHHVVLEEAARLLRSPPGSEGRVRQALDSAEAEATDRLPAELPDELGGEEGWRVVGPFRPRRPSAS